MEDPPEPDLPSLIGMAVSYIILPSLLVAALIAIICWLCNWQINFIA